MIPTAHDHPLPRDGTSQPARDLPELNPNRSLLDDRGLDDLLVLVRDIATRVPFWNLSNTVDGTWGPFFDKFPAVQLAVVAGLQASEVAGLFSDLAGRVDISDPVQGRRALHRWFEPLITECARFDAWARQFRGIPRFAPIPDRAIAFHLRPALAASVGVLKAALAPESSSWLAGLSRVLIRDAWHSTEPGHPTPGEAPPAAGVAAGDLARVVEAFSALSSEVARAIAFAAAEARAAAQPGALATTDQPPHLGLALACLTMFRHAQGSLNDLVRRHLEFYYRSILQIRQRPPVPDEVFAVFEPARQALPIRLASGTAVFAGKDAAKQDIVFGLVRDLIVNQAKVAELRSLFVDRQGHRQLRIATVANSSDGIGGALAKASPSWPPFGDASRPEGRRGFAVAAPTLRMTGGQKTVTVSLLLPDPATAQLQAACAGAAARGGLPAAPNGDFLLTGTWAGAITGPKGWITIAPDQVEVLFQPALRRLRFRVGPLGSDTLVVPHNTKVHLRRFPTAWPVLELTLAPATAVHPGDFFDALEVESAEVLCDVSDDLALWVASDAGALNAAKPFQPFGPIPTARQGSSLGSGVYIGSPEIFRKRLLNLSFAIEWKGLPTDLASYFAAYYDARTSRIHYLPATTATATGTSVFAISGMGSKVGVSLGLGSVAQAPPAPAFRVTAWYLSDTKWVRLGATARADLFGSELPLDPVALSSFAAAPELPDFKSLEQGLERGFVRLSLDEPSFGFGHALYPRLVTEAVVAAVKNPDASAVPNTPNPPFSPVISRLAADYKAIESLVFRTGLDTDGRAATLEWHYVEPHGEWRVTGPGNPALLPPTEYDAAFLVGLSDFTGDQQLSLLLHLADGSGNPFLDYPALAWSYLAGDDWAPFAATDILHDGTHQLRRTGVLLFSVPGNASNEHTRLPAGRVWLRATALGATEALNRAYAVYAEAAEAVFQPGRNDLSRLGTPLPAGSAARLVTTRPEIKKVLQPLPSSSGQAGEAGVSYYRRVSERLRHRDRAVAVWDYEHLVLQAFPQLHQVKCVPHSSPDSELAPGHVMVVPVPRSQPDAFNPLQPAASQDLLADIEAFLLPRMSGLLQRGAGGRVSLHVVNPSYEELQVVAQVVLHQAFSDRGFYQRQLQADLTRFLAPWAYGQNAALSFTTRIHPSMILNFIEELEYVDYVTDFSVRQFVNGAALSPDPAVLTPTTERSLLVPRPGHDLLVPRPGRDHAVVRGSAATP